MTNPAFREVAEARGEAMLPVPEDALAVAAGLAPAARTATPSLAAGADAINFAWLLKLRWGAIVGQGAIIALAEWELRIRLPLLPLLIIIGGAVASNVACVLWARHAPAIGEWTLALVMALDVLLLTALLYWTGGPSNPFSFLYLVHIALAAVVLRPRLTWALVALSLACFGLLFLDHVGLPLDPAEHVQHMRMHLEGMWVAFGVAAGFIVYFVQRVTGALAQREAELVAARNLTARNEKFASLATLAAGAAHELSTPLSTIAVVAKELERQLERGGNSTEAVADARLIREQVERCRQILLCMAADAGQGTGEPIVPVTIAQLVDAALEGLPGQARIAVTLAEVARRATLHLPVRAVAQALRGVLKNAQQASPPTAEVQLHVDADEQGWRFEVHDRGTGMTAEVVGHAGEPFFTTKPPGQGMGLGLFLTRAVVARLGGRLDLESAPACGTTAVLVLPAAPPATIHRIVSDGTVTRG